MAALLVRVQHAPFDMAAEAKRLKKLPGVGAVVTFSGLCRDEGGRLAALELEHYPGMAEDEITRIAEEAATRWQILGAAIIHRTGTIAVGDDIVLVATASAHRGDAFSAANFIMDYLKTRAPFWKKEHPAGAAAGEWVGTHDGDDHAAARWRTKT